MGVVDRAPWIQSVRLQSSVRCRSGVRVWKVPNTTHARAAREQREAAAPPVEERALAAAGRRDVIVLDHHLGGETLPPALAVVNPNRADEDGSLGHLCAAGVVFLTLVQAGRVLRRMGRPEPDLLSMLDLVALATVADVAPLVGVNRAFVRTGLAIMARRQRPGLVALSDVARLDGPPNSFHLGFLLGPRINAGGRVGRADLGALCLSATDPVEAGRLAADLDGLNRDRRAIEAAVRDEALAQVEARGDDRAHATGAAPPARRRRGPGAELEALDLAVVLCSGR